MKTRAAAGVVVLGALACAACGREDVRADFAPSVKEGRARVSIVGIYREGRFSPESWDLMGPTLSSAFGARACETGLTDAWRNLHPHEWDDIDQDARRDGVTEELLARLAPAAKGDLLLVVNYYGPAPTGVSGKPAAPPSLPSTQPLPTTTRRGGLGMSGGGMPGGAREPPGHAPINVELSASLYSVKEHAFVGALEMEHDGAEADLALKHFTERLGNELRGATCVGWNDAAPASPAPADASAPNAAAPDAGAPSADASAPSADADAPTGRP